MELLSTTSNHSNNLDANTLNITTKCSTSNIENIRDDRQQNVDYVQLKHFLENDDGINRSQNVVPERCCTPDNICTGKYAQFMPISAYDFVFSCTISCI